MCPCASYSGKRYSRRFNRAAETAAPQNGRDKRDRMARLPRMESRHLGGLRLL